MFGKRKAKPLSEAEARAAFNAAIKDAIKTALDHRVPRQAIANALESHGAETMAPIYDTQQRRQFA
jgi:hypothetical protein